MAETSSPNCTMAPAEAHGAAALWQDKKKRYGILLAIFALILFSSGRQTAGGAPPQAAPTPVHAGTSRNWSEQLVHLTRDAAPSEAALESLLSRYDAVIRLLEMRIAEAPSASADSVLSELRTLRLQTYSALRRALPPASQEPAARPPHDNLSSQ
jgi:hypothetical protein